MNYKPRSKTESIAIGLALKAGSLYHTYGPGEASAYHKVVQKNDDGTFELEPVNPPAGAQK